MPDHRTRQPLVHLRRFRSLAAFVVLGAFAACGELPEGADDATPETASEATETTSGALLNNVPYVPSGKAGPAAAIFLGKAFLGYVRTDGKIGIIIETNLGDNTGQSVTSYALTDTTTYGPCLVVYQNKLHLIYVDAGGFLKVRRSTDGLNWDNPTNMHYAAGFSYQPSAVVLNSTLLVFCRITSKDIVEIRWIGSPQSIVSTLESSNRGPYATVWNGTVYLTWAGTAADNPIYIKHRPPLGEWSSPTLVSGNVGFPALFPVDAQTLALIYRGNNTHIYRVNTNDGVSFGAPVVDNSSVTNYTPIPFMRVSPQSPSVWTFYTGQNGLFYTAKE
jgi:hypothetical protein